MEDELKPNKLEPNKLETWERKYKRLKKLTLFWWVFMLIFGLVVIYVFFNLTKFVECPGQAFTHLGAVYKNITLNLTWENILNNSFIQERCCPC